jgi:Ca-activated chloride channel family protein
MKTILYGSIVAALMLSACSDDDIDTHIEKPHSSAETIVSDNPPTGSPANSLLPETVADEPPQQISRADLHDNDNVAIEMRERAFIANTASPPAASSAPKITISPVHRDFTTAQPPMSTHALPANTERYGTINDNPIKLVSESPVSTFSVDVDHGSYSNVRRMLNHGQLPPVDAVRVEEMINYFPYDYALPKSNTPFAIHTALAPTPWNHDNILLRVALKGQDIAKNELPPANLVFLIDVSGSMSSPDKLPLLCASMKALAQQLRPQDKITIVTYSGDTRIALPATSGDEKAKITDVIDSLYASGGTAGGAGIQLAYQEAQKNFIKGGINRILLATDGDFNIGITDFDQLKKMVEEKRKSGISLSTLGFGDGNYNEHLMEQLADVGNGAYSYIDTLMEGHKVLVNEMTSTLATIAKDVKIQIEFNPAAVKEYRLIGYENRVLNREDFNNDKMDAGDIGAGHTVTALYEITLVGKKGTIEPLRYQAQTSAPNDAKTDELAYVKLRYKQPNADSSTLVEHTIRRNALAGIDNTDDEFRFATAVAGFGQLLRGNTHLGTWRYEDAHALAASAVAADLYGYRREFIRLIDVAKTLSANAQTSDNLAPKE